MGKKTWEFERWFGLLLMALVIGCSHIASGEELKEATATYTLLLADNSDIPVSTNQSLSGYLNRLRLLRHQNCSGNDAVLPIRRPILIL